MLKFSTFFLFAFSLIPIATNSQTIGQWFADSRSGCKIWDETPQPLQSIKFEGTCTKKLAQGQGKVTFFKNGLFDQVWDANWVDGKAVGKLTVTYTDGAKYYGQLIKGEKNGQGSFIYASGDTYEGEFLNGKFHGNGNYSKKNGWRYSGQFEKDQFS